ncbi:unnamed protein product [marine sediment metagenome]|uniref:Uncharacterized protein n=1 Tax=marine sediment metagenome TaxID=412755 RepID=X1V6T9_9ZZZZ
MDEPARKILLALGLVGGAGLLVWLGTRHSSSKHSEEWRKLETDSSYTLRRTEAGPQQLVPIVRQLPTVTIREKKYYLDARLREYRAVDDPHDRIPLEPEYAKLLGEASEGSVAWNAVVESIIEEKQREAERAGTGRSSSSNPSPRVAAEVPVPPVLPDSVIVEKKVREWVAKGYPEGLARKAAKWAQGWSIGLTARLGMPTEYAAKIYPKSLTLAERWLEGVWGLFA